MIRLSQHIPAFVDGCEPKQASIDTAEDLEKVEWIQSWARHPGFHRFSFSSKVPEGRGFLMAEFHDGNEFYVIAYSDQAIPFLPEWHETELARERRDAWNRGDLEEVDRLEKAIRKKQ